MASRQAFAVMSRSRTTLFRRVHFDNAPGEVSLSAVVLVHSFVVWALFRVLRTAHRLEKLWPTERKRVKETSFKRKEMYSVLYNFALSNSK